VNDGSDDIEWFYKCCNGFDSAPRPGVEDFFSLSLSCAPTEPSLASVLGGGNREFDLSEFMDEVWPLTAHSSNELQMSS